MLNKVVAVQQRQLLVLIIPLPPAVFMIKKDDRGKFFDALTALSAI